MPTCVGRHRLITCVWFTLCILDFRHKTVSKRSSRSFLAARASSVAQRYGAEFLRFLSQIMLFILAVFTAVFLADCFDGGCVGDECAAKETDLEALSQ